MATLISKPQTLMCIDFEAIPGCYSCGLYGLGLGAVQFYYITKIRLFSLVQVLKPFIIPSWVAVKIMVPSIIIRHLIFRVPKTGL